MFASIDTYRQQNDAVFLRILRSLVRAARQLSGGPSQSALAGAVATVPPLDRWLRSARTGSDVVAAVAQLESVSEFAALFERYRELRDRPVAMTPVEDDSGTAAGETSDTAVDADARLPRAVRIAKHVLQRVPHLLGAYDAAQLRLLVLDILMDGLYAVGAHENTLLPLVHACWRPLVARLHDRDRRVRARAMLAVAQMATVCGEFVNQRVLDNAWTPMLHIIRQHTPGQGAAALPAYSLDYKLRLGALCALATLCRALPRIDAGAVDALLDALLPLVSGPDGVPPGLDAATIDAAMGVLHAVAAKPPAADVLWLVLASVHGPGALDPAPAADASLQRTAVAALSRASLAYGGARRWRLCAAAERLLLGGLATCAGCAAPPTALPEPPAVSSDPASVG